MAVGIAGAYRDQGDGGVHLLDESRVAEGRTVVRHLEHVGAQVLAAGQQCVLPLHLGIPGEEQGATGRPHAQDDGAVVGIGPGAVEGGEGPQDLQPQTADGAPLPHAGAQECRPGRMRRPDDTGPGQSRLVQGPHLHSCNGSAVQHAGQTADVVDMQVGNDQQRDPPHPEAAQALVDAAWVRPGVDDHTGVWAGVEY